MKSSGIWAEKVLTFGKPQVTRPHLFNVALVEPEIPQNTGNIGRTCVATHSTLNLVGKMGFKITDTNLKRAGLDYWDHLTWQSYENISDWQKDLKDPKRVYYFSAKADIHYTEVDYQQGDWFVFGKETKGLPEDLMQSNTNQLVLIPLLGPARGLNVATAVAIALYEGIRQLQVKKELDPSLLEVQWGKL